MSRFRSPTRFVLLVCAATILALSAVGCSGGGGGAADRTLRFTTRNDQRSTLDLGEVGPSQHDVLTVEGELFEDGNSVGRFDISYTTTDFDGVRERKVGIAVLEWRDGSKLVLESVNNFDVGAGVPATTEHVIVGGTKDHLGAEGVCEVAFVAGTFEWTCTILE